MAKTKKNEKPRTRVHLSFDKKTWEEAEKTAKMLLFPASRWVEQLIKRELVRMEHMRIKAIDAKRNE